MSRRRRGVEKSYTRLNVVCVCGEALGKVYKQPMPGGRNRYIIPRPLEFRDLPEPTPTSGKMVRRCPECGAEFQRRWDKLREMLDEMETRGIPIGEVGP